MSAHVTMSPMERAAARHTAAFITDRDGLVEFANARYASACRTSLAYLIGSSHPLVSRLARARQINEGWHGKFWSEGIDGHSAQLEVTLVPRHSAQGELLGYFCLAHESTVVEPARIAPRPTPEAKPGAGLVGIFLTSPLGEPLFLSDDVHARYARLPAPLFEADEPTDEFAVPSAPAAKAWLDWLHGDSLQYSTELMLPTRTGTLEPVRQRAVRMFAHDRCIGIVGTLEANPDSDEHGLPPHGHGASIPELFDGLMGHAARFVRNLLSGAHFHDLDEVDSFLREFAHVALASHAIPRAGAARTLLAADD